MVCIFVDRYFKQLPPKLQLFGLDGPERSWKLDLRGLGRVGALARERCVSIGDEICSFSFVVMLLSITSYTIATNIHPAVVVRKEEKENR